MGGISVPNPLSKGAPDMPDYKGASEQATRNSRPNQNTPWASSTWTSGSMPGAPGAQSMLDRMLHRAPGAPTGDGRDTQTIGLAGPLDAANQSMMGQLQSAWGTPLDNGAGARQHAEDAIYGRATARLDPMWDQRQHSMQTDLANQGIDPNSAAYGKSLDNFSRGRNDAYSSALQDAITGGGQEASRQQAMDLQSRLAPFLGMQGIQGLSGMPGFQTGGNPLQAAALHGHYGMDAAQYNRDFWKDLIAGGAGAVKAGGLGGAAAASDERLKTDIRRFADVDFAPGVPVASFRYVWEPVGTRHLGVIAQDVEAVCPGLVTYRGGYRYVPVRFLLT